MHRAAASRHVQQRLYFVRNNVHLRVYSCLELQMVPPRYTPISNTIMLLNGVIWLTQSKSCLLMSPNTHQQLARTAAHVPTKKQPSPPSHAVVVPTLQTHETFYCKPPRLVSHFMHVPCLCSVLPSFQEWWWPQLGHRRCCFTANCERRRFIMTVTRSPGRFLHQSAPCVLSKQAEAWSSTSTCR